MEHSRPVGGFALILTIVAHGMRGASGRGGGVARWCVAVLAGSRREYSSSWRGGGISRDWVPSPRQSVERGRGEFRSAKLGEGDIVDPAHGPWFGAHPPQWTPWPGDGVHERCSADLLDLLTFAKR